MVKQRKGFLAILLSVVMIAGMLCVAPVSAMAEGEAEVFTSGNYDYIILEDGTAEINKYNGTETDITIPTELDGKAVTSIGANSFRSVSANSIVIPNGIVEIKNNAFMYCTATSISIPNSVTTIGFGAFSQCKNITSVEIPDSVITIDSNAFQGCKKMTSVKLSENITAISDFMFSECEGLTNVIIPKNVTIIGQSAFSHCIGFTEFFIPENVKIIDGGAFSYCENLTSVTISEGVEEVYPGAFSNCMKLMEITVPKSVTFIMDKAFGYWFDKSVWNDIPIAGFVLKGYTGSAAEAYAKSNNVKFESIGVVDPTIPSDPTDPTDPTDPSKPSDPTTPTQPQESYVLGDANKDEEVTMQDVLKIQEDLAKIRQFEGANRTAADVNANGEIDMNDILEIQKYLAKIPTQYKIGEKIIVETPTQPTEPPTTPIDNTVTVHVKHSGTENWTPYLWAWTGENTNVYNDWPGKAISDKDTNGWYTTSFEIPDNAESYGIIISNNGNPQSADYKNITAKEIWVVINDDSIINKGQWLTINTEEPNA